MSEYREDTQETAWAKDESWMKLRNVVNEELAIISDSIIVGLYVEHTETAIAHDEFFGRAMSVTDEYATATDELFGSRRSFHMMVETVRAEEEFTAKLTAVIEDGAKVDDLIIDRTIIFISEEAVISDEATGLRKASSLISESAKASDYSAQFAKSLVEESVLISDANFGSNKSKMLVVDSAIAEDIVIDIRHATKSITYETAKAIDEIFGKLHAKQLTTETAVIEDTILGTEGFGQTWTANSDNWAMSRYHPIPFESIAVINGTLYGSTSTGVYALSGRSEEIPATIKTGKIDFGGGMLTHPLACYLEYELDGRSSMSVTTTQGGTPASYDYQLPDKQALDMTSNRFVFGRGLRGRHFALTMKITGFHAHINDMHVETANTARRI